MSTDTGVPNLQDEIDRKAWEALESIHKSFLKGEITYREFALGASTLSNALLGLVSDKQFFVALSEILEDVNEPSYDRTSVFINGDSGEAAILHCPHPFEVISLRRLKISKGQLIWNIQKFAFKNKIVPTEACRKAFLHDIPDLLKRNGFDPIK